MISLTSRQRINRIGETWFESPGVHTRLLPMEGLRGLAVLLVFFVHAHALFGPYIATDPRLFGISEYLGGTGNVGVDLFFALSGFLIYGALIHKRVRYFSFLQRRAKRIYPVFLAVLFFYLSISIIFPAESRLPASTAAIVKYIIENLLFLPGICPITPIVTVAWSLSFEFAFYLFVPLVVLILRHGEGSNVRRLGLLGALWVVFSVLEACFLRGAHIRMVSFLSGMLLQEIRGGGRMSSFLSQSGQWASIVAFVLLASYHFALRSKQSVIRSSEVLSMALLSVSIFFFVMYALEYPGILQKVCTWKPLRYWGNISYSYYLAHGITLKGVAILVAKIGPRGHSILTYCSALAFGLVFSWMSAILLYALVEKPFSLTPRKPCFTTEEVRVISLSGWMRRGRPAPEVTGNR